VVDEPVTVVISSKGWVRARTGHGHDAGGFAFKAGDGLYGTFECRTVDTLIVFGSAQNGVGRVYSVPVASLPGARGDGQPITTLIDLEAGTQPLHYFAGAAGTTLLISGSGGYGFLATVDDLVSRQKAGKAFVTLNEGETLCAPALASGGMVVRLAGQEGGVIAPPTAPEGGEASAALAPATHVCCVSTGGRILTFELSELKLQPKGGRGLMLMSLDDKDSLAGAAAYTRSVRIEGVGRGGKWRDETLEIRSLNNARGVRGRKGKDASFGFKPARVCRLV
jgi:topoisomerase IV subunit A